MEPLLNMEQAAKLLGLEKHQLYELTRNRSRSKQLVPLPMITIGKRRMFKAASLEAWVAELEQLEIPAKQ